MLAQRRDLGGEWGQKEMELRAGGGRRLQQIMEDFCC